MLIDFIFLSILIAILLLILVGIIVLCILDFLGIKISLVAEYECIEKPGERIDGQENKNQKEGKLLNHNKVKEQ